MLVQIRHRKPDKPIDDIGLSKSDIQRRMRQSTTVKVHLPSLGWRANTHISPAAAAYQVERVARARHLPVERVKTLVAEHTTAPILGVFGEPVVNVLELNLGLGDLK
ncbi:hypothetical protein ACH51_17220 (plasmid) [Ralstonia solanacearum]|nr:hypothetical protein ACH51_17220 [Ralstonia solanacearum]